MFMIQKHYPCVAYFRKDDEKKIRNLQKELSILTRSKSCLLEWQPHITVGKALELNKFQLQSLKKELKDFASNQSSFDVEFKDYGFMIHKIVAKLYNCEPYVVYLKIVVNPMLLAFVKKLNVIMKKYDFKFDIFPYNPHLTLAFKDLDQKGYKKAKKYLKNKLFSEVFKITSLSLATDKKGGGQFKEVLKFKLKK